jgi:hypothetical protein
VDSGVGSDALRIRQAREAKLDRIVYKHTSIDRLPISAVDSLILELRSRIKTEVK